MTLDELREVRVRFLAEQGWGETGQIRGRFEQRDRALAGFGAHHEVVLWFEHDLYDQLQLIQILDWFAGQVAAGEAGSEATPNGGGATARAEAPRASGSEQPVVLREGTRLSLVGTGDYLGRMGAAQLQGHFAARAAVSEAMMGLAVRAWAAFRSTDPRDIEALCRGAEGLWGAGMEALPFLAGALRRHLEEFPGVGDGLSRSERQALQVIGQGVGRLDAVYQAAHHGLETAIFLGDTVFASMVARLGAGAFPLLCFEDGGIVHAPRVGETAEDFWGRRVVLTEDGRRVLAGEVDQVALRGIDRWRGGVHLHGHTVPWRWDASRGQLVTG